MMHGTHNVKLIVQWSHTECGVSGCDREAWPTGGCRAMEKICLLIISHISNKLNEQCAQ